KLSRDVFLALCAIGWADGQLDREEADGILRAASESGLGLEELAEIEAATKQKRGLDTLDRKRLTPLERAFVYATAIWLARLDGSVDPDEKMALHKLGDLLALPDGIRTHASAAALETAQLPTGDRPARYDFERLKERLWERLSKAQSTDV
ncbi:MAG: tellurite resistance TerB family protein, partial [Polyangiales bacterium]